MKMPKQASQSKLLIMVVAVSVLVLLLVIAATQYLPVFNIVNIIN